MRILSLSLDKNLFAPDSKVAQRQREYGALCEELHILVLSSGAEAKLAGNVYVYAVGGSKINRIFKAIKKAKSIVKEYKIDLISAQDPFFTGLVAYLVARKNRIPWHCQIHTDFLSPYFRQESFLNKCRIILANYLLPKASGIRVVSQRIKNSLKKHHLKCEPFVLPIFIDVGKFRGASVKTDLRQKYSQFDFIILMASRLSREKNIALAIDAMREIVKEFPKAGLIIIGHGEEKKRLELKTKNYKLQTNIVFEPWSDDLASYYKSADLFLLTSNYEGYGLAAVEAMAAGCPILMTDVGCAGELVRHNESGIIIPVGQGEKLEEAIINLSKVPSLTDTLREGTRHAIALLPSKEEYLFLYKKSWEGVLV